jgi:hypothetical protein
MFEDQRTRLGAAGPGPESAPSLDSPETPSTPTAQERFRSCRWSATGDPAIPDHCTHRDVLPFAGTTGFNPEAWCPNCKLYKLRRTPRKRPDDDY